MMKLEIGNWKFKSLYVMSAQAEARPKSGFTLLEILVVISIIAILAGMLVPMFMNSKERARETKARAEVQGLEIAFKQYLADNKVWPDAIADETPQQVVDSIFAMVSGIYEFGNMSNYPSATTAYDPWADPSRQSAAECNKHAYYVAFDDNYDNTITVNGQGIHRSVLVWSPGINGYNNNFGSDEGVASWK